MRPTPQPRRTVVRRLERWAMGVVMGIGAFFIEKLVMRSIRRGGGTVPAAGPAPTPITTRGVDIEG